MRGMLLLLVGCGGGGGLEMTGDWTGLCSFSDYGMDLDLTLTQEDETVTGDAAGGFSWQGVDFSFSGTAEGTVSEDDLLLTLSFDSDGGTVVLDVAMADPDRVEGECSGDGGISGGGWLER